MEILQIPLPDALAAAQEALRCPGWVKRVSVTIGHPGDQSDTEFVWEMLTEEPAAAPVDEHLADEPAAPVVDEHQADEPAAAVGDEEPAPVLPTGALLPPVGEDQGQEQAGANQVEQRDEPGHFDFLSR